MVALFQRATLSIAFGSILLAAAASPALAIHSLAGTWLVTYYLDPTSTQGSTQCINTRKTGETNGVISGTWSSPTLQGWRGQWTEKGQHYEWHGTYVVSGTTYATFDVGDFITPLATAETSAATFQAAPTGPTTVSTGTATMTMVANCHSAPIHHGPNAMDGQ